MKAAFSTTGETLESPLESRFGRAAKFLIYDLEGKSFEVIDNQQNLNAAQGAGVQAAGTVARAGVQSVVTGHCGPKAFRVLSQAGIHVYVSEPVSIAAALEAWQAGKLQEIKSADVEGHWG